MTNKSYPADVLPQAQIAAEAWRKINPSMTVGDLALTALTADLEQVLPIQTQLDALDVELTDLRNRRDALLFSIWNKVKRARAGIKGIYGDDSSEYEMIGGTRLSDRKSPTRKPSTS